MRRLFYFVPFSICLNWMHISNALVPRAPPIGSKLSKNVAPKASRRGRRRCWKMMKMIKYSIFSAPAASIGGAEGAPKGRHRLHWSAGGETHVARPARCLREERGRCGPYDLRHENTIFAPTFQQKTRNLEAHFRLKQSLGGSF